MTPFDKPAYVWAPWIVLAIGLALLVGFEVLDPVPHCDPTLATLRCGSGAY